MKELFILRGLPGSGKSTLGALIADVVCSADDHFVGEDGVYRFEPTKLKAAHSACGEKCEEAMVAGTPRIAIANTSTREWEWEWYVQLAKKYGYRVHSLIAENRHHGHNIHGVPEEAIAAMRERFEVSL